MLVYMAISDDSFLQRVSVKIIIDLHDIAVWSDWYFKRVVAIDQRGYGLSSKPSQVKDYKVDILARDTADEIEQSDCRMRH